MINLRKWLAGAAAIWLVSGLAAAADVLLTVEDAEGRTTTFTRDALEAMPVTEFTTSTIWTEGAASFTGVELSDFLAEIGVEGGVLEASAINDYTIELPVADAVAGGPIIAYLMNGEEMSARTKGPLWIVYPYDSETKYQNDIYYSRSIWQLSRIKTAR